MGSFQHYRNIFNIWEGKTSRDNFINTLLTGKRCFAYKEYHGEKGVKIFNIKRRIMRPHDTEKNIGTKG